MLQLYSEGFELGDLQGPFQLHYPILQAPRFVHMWPLDLASASLNSLLKLLSLDLTPCGLDTHWNLRTTVMRYGSDSDKITVDLNIVL